MTALVSKRNERKKYTRLESEYEDHVLGDVDQPLPAMELRRHAGPSSRDSGTDNRDGYHDYRAKSGDYPDADGGILAERITQVCPAIKHGGTFRVPIVQCPVPV